MQHAHPGSGGAARGTGKGRAGTRSSVVGFAGGNTKADNPIADFASVPIVPKKQARPRTTACQRCPRRPPRAGGRRAYWIRTREAIGGVTGLCVLATLRRRPTCTWNNLTVTGLGVGGRRRRATRCFASNTLVNSKRTCTSLVRTVGACQVPTTRTCLLNHPMPQSGLHNHKHTVHTARTRAGPHAQVAATVIQRLWRSVLIRRVFRSVRPPGIMIESAPCTPSSCAGIRPWHLL